MCVPGLCCASQKGACSHVDVSQLNTPAGNTSGTSLAPSSLLNMCFALPRLASSARFGSCWSTASSTPTRTQVRNEQACGLVSMMAVLQCAGCRGFHVVARVAAGNLLATTSGDLVYLGENCLTSSVLQAKLQGSKAVAGHTVQLKCFILLQILA